MMTKFVFHGMLRSTLAAILMAVGILMANQSGFAQAAGEGNAPQNGLVESLRGDELFAKVLENNHSRDLRLRQYSETRSYAVTSDKGKLHAMSVFHLHYTAPSTKSFATVCEEGSGTVRNLVFKRLIESELETAGGRSHHDSSITPANYSFELFGEQDRDGRHYYVVQAIPKRKDKYLFEGKIWIDGGDFAITKIEGHPARNPSFWINRVDFVREYQKIGDFWLPLEDKSITHLKLVGTKILTIEHFDYLVNQSESSQSETSDQSPNPSSQGCQATQAVRFKPIAAANTGSLALIQERKDGDERIY